MQAGQINKGMSNGSILSTRSAIGAHSLEVVTHHVRCKSLPAQAEVSFLVKPDGYSFPNNTTRNMVAPILKG